MLRNSPVTATIPVVDLNRAKDFYTNKIGLEIDQESEGDVTLKAGDGTYLYLYKREPSKGDHTLAAFSVPDLEKVVNELISKGITFEQYDTEYIKTNELGIAEWDEMKVAWFKDSEGNILGIDQKK
jgi:catechol 2,3-dioxygenase-like lactoylglutathione lyase family enzyme